ncbi:UNVERIFIED_CONTAM: hypothetical protein K2H54_024515 [Gekko kuhli]
MNPSQAFLNLKTKSILASNLFCANDFEAMTGELQMNEDSAFKISSLAAKQHIFKWPTLRASLQGLDLLAAQKRREKEHQASGGSTDSKDGPMAAQKQVAPPPDGDEGEGEGDSQATSRHSSHKDTHYRSAEVETPSHTRGVSDGFWECSRQREWEQQGAAADINVDRQQQYILKETCSQLQRNADWVMEGSAYIVAVLMETLHHCKLPQTDFDIHQKPKAWLQQMLLDYATGRIPKLGAFTKPADPKRDTDSVTSSLEDQGDEECLKTRVTPVAARGILKR